MASEPNQNDQVVPTVGPAQSSGSSTNEELNRDSAADVIRKKLDSIYHTEPNAQNELEEAKEINKLLSKHQKYMIEISKSGKSLAEIQTNWHNYYTGLPDEEKLEVWQEFYDNAGPTSEYFKNVSGKVQVAKENRPTPQAQLSSTVVVADHALAYTPKKRRRPPATEVKKKIVKHVTANGQLSAKHHFQSLSFGLAVGFLAVVIFLFGFFNEVIIAPFIQPSRNAASTPLILNPDSIAASATPEVIIPKINVEIPVDFSQTSTNEATIEGALNSGVVHYPSTVTPGQIGNAAFFGHSSNNIFNPGKYKFAFVLLHTLVSGDTFYISYNGKVYIYQVFDKKIVPPDDVGVLASVPNRTSTVTLITCDPPGTSTNRLVVWGTQISPDPNGNTAPTITASINGGVPKSLPGNGPTLWSRFYHWVF